MSKLAFLSIVALLFIEASCSKSASGPDAVAGLEGRWKLNEYFMGMETNGWEPAPSGQSFIELYQDGRIATDVNLFERYIRFSVLNDSTIRFFETNVVTVDMRLALSADSLKLQISPSCFEGCSFKFVKQ